VNDQFLYKRNDGLVKSSIFKSVGERLSLYVRAVGNQGDAALICRKGEGVCFYWIGWHSAYAMVAPLDEAALADRTTVVYRSLEAN